MSLPSLSRRFASFPVSPPVVLTMLAAAAFSPMALAAPKGVLPTQYTVTALGVLTNPGASSVVRAGDSFGNVVGGDQGSGPLQSAGGFILSSTGFSLITNQLSADYGVCYGINDGGEIVGMVNGPNSVLPFRSVKHAQFQRLSLLPGDTGGAAYAINQSGEAAGFTTGAAGIHAVWWTRQGQVTQLGAPAGGTTAKAVAINDKGDLAGTAGDGDTTAVRWVNKGGIIPLDTLAGFTSSEGDSINTGGDVVGASTSVQAFGTRMHATLWPAGTTNPQDLGVLSGGTNSRARNVDDNDLVVGTGDSSMGNRAFIWSSGSGMVDLNTLAINTTLILVDAIAITKQGVIVAIGIDVSDAPPMHAMGTMVATSHVEERELPRHIVLLTPVK